MSKKEEFSSNDGSTICLGRYKCKESHPSSHDTMLLHSMTVERQQPANAFHGAGLANTKFGKGFMRRQQPQIAANTKPFVGEVIDSQGSIDQMKTIRAERTAQLRTQTLKIRDNPSGYDIISGRPKDPILSKASSTSSSVGIRTFSSSLGEEAPQRGKYVLHQSEGRYFSPLPSGNHQEYRQTVLHHEGLLCPKTTGILEARKRDLPSFGVEDQFSKSQYMKTSIIAQTGLVEKNQPGKYTPRKIPDHPSGNAEIVKKWTTDADLNQRTLRGIL
eukprot:gene2475-2713_t